MDLPALSEIIFWGFGDFPRGTSGRARMLVWRLREEISDEKAIFAAFEVRN